jgi:hypothetical protein
VMDKRLFCTYGIVKRLHIIRCSLAPYPSIMGRSLTIPQYGKASFSITWRLRSMIDGWWSDWDAWTAGPRPFWFQSPCALYPCGRFTRSFCEAFCEVLVFLVRCFGFYGGATGKEE